jgi:hypothetical protein
LSIVRHVAQAHGGEVAVDSIEGQGSTFRFIVPLAEGGNGTNGASQHTGAVSGNGVGANGTGNPTTEEV